MPENYGFSRIPVQWLIEKYNLTTNYIALNENIPRKNVESFDVKGFLQTIAKKWPTGPFIFYQYVAYKGNMVYELLDGRLRYCAITNLLDEDGEEREFARELGLLNDKYCPTKLLAFYEIPMYFLSGDRETALRMYQGIVC